MPAFRKLCNMNAGFPEPISDMSHLSTTCEENSLFCEKTCVCPPPTASLKRKMRRRETRRCRRRNNQRDSRNFRKLTRYELAAVKVFPRSCKNLSCLVPFGSFIQKLNNIGSCGETLMVLRKTSHASWIPKVKRTFS